MPDLIIIAGPNGAGKTTIFPAIQNVGRIEGSFQPDVIPNPLCWGGNIYADEKIYTTDKEFVEKLKTIALKNEIPFNNNDICFYDVFSPFVFSKIKELVIEETKKRPKGNYVVVQRQGKIEFQIA